MTNLKLDLCVMEACGDFVELSHTIVWLQIVSKENMTVYFSCLLSGYYAAVLVLQGGVLVNTLAHSHLLLLFIPAAVISFYFAFGKKLKRKFQSWLHPKVANAPSIGRALSKLEYINKRITVGEWKSALSEHYPANMGLERDVQRRFTMKGEVRSYGLSMTVVRPSVQGFIVRVVFDRRSFPDD